MKCVVEYGTRGGYHKDNLVLPSAGLGAELAASVANTLEGRQMHYPGDWKVSTKRPRVTWSNATHFVAVSILDGVPRGAASASLWKATKP